MNPAKPSFRSGVAVTHPRLGAGTVLRADATEMLIKLASGRRLRVSPLLDRGWQPARKSHLHVRGI